MGLGGGSAANADARSYGINLGPLFSAQSSLANANAAAGGGLSGSGANSQSLTNSITVLGVPIGHTIGGSQSASSGGAAGASLNQGFQLGGFQRNRNYALGVAGN